MAKVIGVEGIFFKCTDPKKMSEWYSDVLGMTTNDYGKLLHIEVPEGNRIELWEPVDQAFSSEPFTPMN